MDWLAFVLAFELGIVPSTATYIYNPPVVVDSSMQFYQEAEVKAILFKTIEIGGVMNVCDWRSKDNSGFWPSKLTSIFYADIILGPVTIGFRHACIHPVMPFQPIGKEIPIWDGWSNQLYARVELELKP